MTLVLWLRLGGRPRINKVAPVYNPGERAANPPKAGKSLGGQTRHWGETMTRGLDPNLVTTAFELPGYRIVRRSEEHTSELQSHHDLVCRLLLEKKKKKYYD